MQLLNFHLLMLHDFVLMADSDLADVSVTGAWATSANVQHEGKELLASAAPFSGPADPHLPQLLTSI